MEAAVKFRPLWPEGEDILCMNCEVEFRWFTVEDRPYGWHEFLGVAEFRLPCGCSSDLFEDVVPLRGHFLRES